MNNNNVVSKTKNVTYYINREKRTVVAIIKCCRCTSDNILLDICDKYYETHHNETPLDISTSHFSGNQFGIDKYIGVAKCHEADVFDEEFGKKLALARAKTKKSDALQKKFFKYVEQLDDLNYKVGKKHDALYRSWIDSKCEVENLLKSIVKE